MRATAPTAGHRAALIVGLLAYLAGWGMDAWAQAASIDGELSTSEGIQAMATLWFGLAILLTTSAWAIVDRAPGPGHLMIVAGALLYGVELVRRFPGHAFGSQVGAPHGVVLASGVVIVAGAAWAAVGRLRAQTP
ncbi:MAG: hypothetical protein HY658_08815 [Actinobacteria bacterium]|nr:hypothetical protein [Actinomycetota bacterium]